MLVCRVVRFYLARLIIDSNRCLLIRYEHGCISHMSSLVISMKQMMRLDCGKMIQMMILLMKLLLIQVLMLLVIMIYLLVH